MKCSDISVGEYVRNRYGYIGKYTKNSNGIYEIKIRNGLVCRINSKEEIVKHSFDIIDLIEDDDFIIIAENGYPLQIRTIWKNGGELNIRLSNEMIFEDIKNDKEFDIKSILTKEIFEANVYKLEE